MNKSTVQTAYDQLSKYCAFHSESDDTLTVTEWPNGEGIDIVMERTSFSDLKAVEFSLTHGELDALIAVSDFLRGSVNDI